MTAGRFIFIDRANAIATGDTDRLQSVAASLAAAGCRYQQARTLVAAGDIACPGVCGQEVTATLIRDVIRPEAVLGLVNATYVTGEVLVVDGGLHLI